MTPPTPPRDFGFKSLDVYIASRELTVLVVQLKLSDPELRDQATRAAKSVLLNLSEGLPLELPTLVRRRHFTIALGSLYELAAALDAIEALGLITTEQLAVANGLAYRARGMLSALAKR